MKRMSFLLACFATGVFFSTSAMSLSFTKIVDTTTLIPGGTGTFAGFGGAAIDGNDIAFYARGSDGGLGVYARIGGSLRTIANLSTSIPGGTGTFTAFPFYGCWLATLNEWCHPGIAPSISHGQVLFRGSGTSGQEGIYLWDGATLRVVANLNTLAPGSSGNYQSFNCCPVLENGDAAFFAGAPMPSGAGMYAVLGGVPVRLWDNTTPLPGQTGSVSSYSGPSISDGDVAFALSFYTGSPGHHGGVFLFHDGAVTMIADNSTLIPNSAFRFSSFTAPSLYHGKLAFGGTHITEPGGINDAKGIYLQSGGALSMIVDMTTQVPGRSNNFYATRSSLPGASQNNGNVVFTYTWSIGPQEEAGGIYARFNRVLTKVIELADLLDGKSLFTSPYIGGLTIGAQALSGNSIVFVAQFVDFSRGIYVTSLPQVPVCRRHWWCLFFIPDPFFGDWVPLRYFLCCYVIPIIVIVLLIALTVVLIRRRAASRN